MDGSMPPFDGSKPPFEGSKPILPEVGAPFTSEGEQANMQATDTIKSLAYSHGLDYSLVITALWSPILLATLAITCKNNSYNCEN